MRRNLILSSQEQRISEPSTLRFTVDSPDITCEVCLVRCHHNVVVVVVEVLCFLSSRCFVTAPNRT